MNAKIDIDVFEPFHHKPNQCTFFLITHRLHKNINSYVGANLPLLI